MKIKVALLLSLFALSAFAQDTRFFDRSAVRAIEGQSCGSATLVFDDGDRQLFLSNAHVTGTETGAVVDIEYYGSGKLEAAAGRLIYAAYVPGNDVDFSFVELRGLSRIDGMEARPLACYLPPDEKHSSGSSPRCVPTGYRAHLFHRRNSITTFTPAAIGGQSGSGIIDKLGSLTTLVTWTNGEVGLGQNPLRIREVLRGGSAIRVFTEIPPDCEKACENPKDCGFKLASASLELIPDAIFACSQDAPEPAPVPPAVQVPEIGPPHFLQRIFDVDGGFADRWITAPELLDTLTK